MPSEIVKLLEKKRAELGEPQWVFCQRLSDKPAASSTYSKLKSGRILLPSSWHEKAASLLGVSHSEIVRLAREVQPKPQYVRPERLTRPGLRAPVANERYPRKTVSLNPDWQYFADLLGSDVHSVLSLAEDLVRKHLHAKAEDGYRLNQVPDPHGDGVLDWVAATAGRPK